MDILKDIEMFKSFTEEELDLVKTLCHPISSDDDETLISENQKGKKTFILLSGRIKIMIGNPVNQEESICLARLKPYEVFGEFALFDDAPRSASAVSQGKSELLEIDSWELNGLLEEHPAMGLKLMRNLGKLLCQRLRNIDIEYRNTSIKPDSR